MSTDPNARAEEERRLAEIVNVVVAIASNDFSQRASVGDGQHLLDGLAAGINMLAEEVGQQYRREQAFRERLIRSARLASLGQLAAGVAHEVNNPAAFVLANLQAMDRLLSSVESAAESSTIREAMQQARELTRENLAGVERIVGIVRELGPFSRLEKHRLEVLQVDELVRDACKLVNAELVYRAQLVIEQQPALRVRGDRARLIHVLTNLLLNAAHAIPEGAPERHQVSVVPSLRQRLVCVAVRDTGLGISAEDQARLFEPFFSTKFRDVGAGLGLTSSAEIMRQHEGDLRLVQTSERGSVFELSLPQEVADLAVVPTPPAPPPAPAPSPAAKLRVLLIDDEESLVKAFHLLLKNEYELTVALGGHAGLSILEGNRAWDVVVCDLMMPDVDGIAIHEWVVANQPALAQRMVFCSGGAFTPRGREFVATIGERLLQKPVRPSVLREMIQRVASDSVK
jgi:signal transduction histidine kinase